MKTVRVKCPLCGKRLFDTSQDTIGEIELKCKCCNKVVKVILEKQNK